MKFAQRLSGMRESFIREMTRLAIEYDAINLSQGFPDFDPPREVIEAAHRALDAVKNQYTVTWGTPGRGKSTVRFAFAKRMETLNAAGERLRQRMKI